MFTSGFIRAADSTEHACRFFNPALVPNPPFTNPEVSKKKMLFLESMFQLRMSSRLFVSLLNLMLEEMFGSVSVMTMAIKAIKNTTLRNFKSLLFIFKERSLSDGASKLTGNDNWRVTFDRDSEKLLKTPEKTKAPFIKYVTLQRAIGAKKKNIFIQKV